RAHYVINRAGCWSTTESRSAFGDSDASRPTLDTSWLVNGSNDQKAQWQDFSICALASSAFPVGLAPRIIGGATSDYTNRLFPSETLVYKAKAVLPNWSKIVLGAPYFAYTTADGGIIDNDPFEYAHFAIKEDGKLDQPVPAALNDVRRAVIMISPFPEEKPIRPEDKPGIDIVDLVSSLFPSLIEQVRFKREALALAADEEHGSRYLIGPSRVSVDAKGSRRLKGMV